MKINDVLYFLYSVVYASRIEKEKYFEYFHQYKNIRREMKKKFYFNQRTNEMKKEENLLMSFYLKEKLLKGSRIAKLLWKY